MNINRLMELGEVPIRLKDDRYAIVIRFSQKQNKIGIQIPMADDIIWIKVENVKEVGSGALIEI